MRKVVFSGRRAVGCRVVSSIKKIDFFASDFFCSRIASDFRFPENRLDYGAENSVLQEEFRAHANRKPIVRVRVRVLRVNRVRYSR